MNEVYGTFCICEILEVNTDGTLKIKIITKPRYDDQSSSEYLDYPVDKVILDKVFVVQPPNIGVKITAGDLGIYLMTRNPILNDLLGMDNLMEGLSNGICIPIMKSSDNAYSYNNKTYIKGDVVIGNKDTAVKIAKGPSTNSNLNTLRLVINSIITTMGLTIPIIPTLPSVNTSDLEGS